VGCQVSELVPEVKFPNAISIPTVMAGFRLHQGVKLLSHLAPIGGRVVWICMKIGLTGQVLLIANRPLLCAVVLNVVLHNQPTTPLRLDQPGQRNNPMPALVRNGR
jgi:hypothetical protein